MLYQYKVYRYQAYSNSKTKSDEELQAVINKMAAAGWEYYELAKLDVIVNPGCLASLFGAGQTSVSLDHLIFRKEKSE